EVIVERGEHLVKGPVGYEYVVVLLILRAKRAGFVLLDGPDDGEVLTGDIDHLADRIFAWKQSLDHVECKDADVRAVEVFGIGKVPAFVDRHVHDELGYREVAEKTGASHRPVAVVGLRRGLRDLARQRYVVDDSGINVFDRRDLALERLSVFERERFPAENLGRRLAGHYERRSPH